MTHHMLLEMVSNLLSFCMALGGLVLFPRSNGWWEVLLPSTVVCRCSFGGSIYTKFHRSSLRSSLSYGSLLPFAILTFIRTCSFITVPKILAERGSIPPSISQNTRQPPELPPCHPNVLKATMVPSSHRYLLSNAQIWTWIIVLSAKMNK